MVQTRFVSPKKPVVFDSAYPEFVAQLVGLLEQARRSSARSVNAIMTGTYWEVGRRIVDQEQQGKRRAQYGKALLHRLAEDLTTRFGKGFSERNLLAMREFYLAWSIPQTPSADSGTLPQPSPLPPAVVALRPPPLRQKTDQLARSTCCSFLGGCAAW
jgi:hypothetical protein